MTEIAVTVNGTETLLKSLNQTKASGPDENLLKLKELHFHLNQNYQKFLLTGIIPERWKSALVRFFFFFFFFLYHPTRVQNANSVTVDPYLLHI